MMRVIALAWVFSVLLSVCSKPLNARHRGLNNNNPWQASPPLLNRIAAPSARPKLPSLRPGGPTYYREDSWSRSRLQKRDIEPFDRFNPQVDLDTITNKPIAWSELLGSEVAIRSKSNKYISGREVVKWVWITSGKVRKSRRPSFWCTSEKTATETFFLYRDNRTTQKLGVLEGGAVHLSLMEDDILEDTNEERPSFHFEPYEDRYKIYASKGGKKYGLPARCEGDSKEMDTFEVLQVAKPLTMTMLMLLQRDEHFKVTTKSAHNHCGDEDDTISHQELLDDCTIKTYGGVGLDVMLLPPIIGNITNVPQSMMKMENGTAFLRTQHFQVTKLAIPPRTPTLLQVLKNVTLNGFVWQGNVTYNNSAKVSEAFGWADNWHFNNYTLLAEVPGTVLEDDEECDPMDDMILYTGVSANRTLTLLDDTEEYPEMPTWFCKLIKC